MKVKTFLRESFVRAFYEAYDGKDDTFKKLLEDGVNRTDMFVIGESRIKEGETPSAGKDKLVPVEIDVDVRDLN